MTGNRLRISTTRIRKATRRNGASLKLGRKAYGISAQLWTRKRRIELHWGAETLALRVTKQCENAQRLCDYLSAHPACKAVYYPGLRDHPEFDRAKRLFKFPGAIFSFELTDGIDIFEFMNSLRVVIKSSNLGDTRTLAIPVAHTIYYEMGPERRASMGIDDSLIRNIDRYRGF